MAIDDLTKIIHHAVKMDSYIREGNELISINQTGLRAHLKRQVNPHSHNSYINW
jgi:hypothetical protein